MTLQGIEADLGIINVRVTNPQDMKESKKTKDYVTSLKTFNSAFNPGQSQYGWEPENILPHTGRRVWGQVFNCGYDYVAGTTQPAPTTPAVPATGVAAQNPNSYPVEVVISANGATITNVSVNGITVGTAAGTYYVPAYGSISIAYSVATPTWAWSNPASNVAASGNSDVYLCSSIGDAQQSPPVGFRLQPTQHVDLPSATTECYIVAYGNGTAPQVAVLSVLEQI